MFPSHTIKISFSCSYKFPISKSNLKVHIIHDVSITYHKDLIFMQLPLLLRDRTNPSIRGLAEFPHYCETQHHTSYTCEVWPWNSYKPLSNLQEYESILPLAYLSVTGLAWTEELILEEDNKKHWSNGRRNFWERSWSKKVLIPSELFAVSGCPKKAHYQPLRISARISGYPKKLRPTEPSRPKTPQKVLSHTHPPFQYPPW